MPLSLQDANALVKNHKDSPINTDKDQHSVGFSAESLQAILAQPGVKGVNFIHAKTQVSSSSLHNTLVAVGYDASGNNVTDNIGDPSQYCPPTCPPPNQGSQYI